MNYYYADNENQTAGPVSLESIKALVKKGVLRRDPMIIPEGATEWRPLSTFLEPEPATIAPPTAPAPKIIRPSPQAATPTPARTVTPAATPIAATPVVAPAKPATAAQPVKPAATPAPIKVVLAAAPTDNKFLLLVQEAVVALKLLALNPAGGLAPASEKLGSSAGLGVGVLFGVVVSLSLMLASFRMADTFRGFLSPGFVFYLKLAVVSFVPYISLTVVGSIARLALRGQGNLGQDCFVAGACLLPLGVAALAAALLGPANYEVVSVIALFGFCLGILMLAAALTEAVKLSARVVTFAAPGMAVLTFILTRIISAAVLR